MKRRTTCSESPALKLKLPSKMRLKFPKRPSAYQIFPAEQQHTGCFPPPGLTPKHLSIFIHWIPLLPMADDISSKTRESQTSSHCSPHTHRRSRMQTEKPACTVPGRCCWAAQREALISRAQRAPEPATCRDAPCSAKPGVPCVLQGWGLTWLPEFSVR